MLYKRLMAVPERTFNLVVFGAMAFMLLVVVVVIASGWSPR
jgi:hypothetical protein